MVDFRCHGTHSNVFGLVFQNPTSGRFYFAVYKASIENHCVEVRKICECITAICVPRCNIEVGYNVVLIDAYSEFKHIIYFLHLLFVHHRILKWWRHMRLLLQKSPSGSAQSG